jgi:hypothetical protein
MIIKLMIVFASILLGWVGRSFFAAADYNQGVQDVVNALQEVQSQRKD